MVRLEEIDVETAKSMTQAELIVALVAASTLLSVTMTAFRVAVHGANGAMIGYRLALDEANEAAKWPLA